MIEEGKVGEQPAAAADEDEGGAALAIRLLGPWDVQVHGRPLPPLRSRKGQWLLALLVLHPGRAVARDWLAGTLWPDSPTTQGLYNLRRNLSDLRRALGPEAARLSSPSPNTLALDLDGAAVDVARFDERIAQGDVGSMEAAVRLYRGPLLPECAEEWIVPERMAREQAYLDALETLAGHAQAQGRPEGAVRFLRRAVAVEPLRESAQAALMEALAAAGDRLEAVRVYHDFSRWLQQEASAVPSSETTALFQRLRAELEADRRAGISIEPEVNLQPAPGTRATGPASNLPVPLSSFVGREQELLQIEAALRGARLVTLTGAGGAGKTRLALQLGRQIVHDYPDGVWFVELAALAPGAEPELLAQTIARVLGVSDPPGRLLLDTLRELLRPKRLLLILDNCEHLLDACAPLVTFLLEGCPELRVLATSRQSLGIIGETDWRVPSLSVPGVGGWGSGVGIDNVDDAPALAGPNARPPTPNALLQFEAVRLFVERGQAATRSFGLTAENAAAVAGICRRLDGLPLALELAAARLKALPVEEVAARLDHRFHLLAGSDHAPLSRHQTLRKTLDWSYDLLLEPESVLLRRLSIFAGGFTLPAAQSVCADFGFWILDFGLPATAMAPEDRTSLSNAAHSMAPIGRTSSSDPIQNPKSKIQNDELLDRLTALVDKSLVQVEAGGRFRLLETVREYAAERLVEAAEQDAIAARHACWAVAMAEAGEGALHGPEQIAWLDRLGEEMDNFRAALEWSLRTVGSGQWAMGSGGKVKDERPPLSELPTAHCPLPTAGRLAGALAPFFLRRGFVVEGRQWLERALEARPAHDAATRAKLLAGAAALCHQQADGEAARRYAEECLALRRSLGDHPGEGEALERLGHVLNLQGDHERATALFEESLALRQAIGDRAGVASVQNARGYMAWFYGDREQAVALCEESLRVRREQGDVWETANALEFLGLALVGKGDAATAMPPLEECLQLRRRLGDKRGIAAALMQLGYAVLSRGDLAGAQAFFEESLPLWRELSNPDSTAVVLMGLGVLARRQGEWARALTLFQEALTLFHQISHYPGLAECLDGMARTARLMGDEQRAAAFAGLAERILEDGKVPLTATIQQWLTEHRAGAAAALGETAAAAAWQEGRAMSVKQAIAAAAEIAPRATSP